MLLTNRSNNAGIEAIVDQAKQHGDPPMVMAGVDVPGNAEN